jgi:hypothetical protein
MRGRLLLFGGFKIIQAKKKKRILKFEKGYMYLNKFTIIYIYFKNTKIIYVAFSICSIFTFTQGQRLSNYLLFVGK